MTTTIDVVYEGGILRPLQTLDWQEGEQHTVTVQAAPPAAPSEPASMAEIWANITAQAVVHDEIETTSTDHDKILYGGPNNAW